MILRSKLRTLNKRNKHFSKKSIKHVTKSTNSNKTLKKMTITKSHLMSNSAPRARRRKITRNNKSITKVT